MAFNLRLDGEGYSYNLLRPELIRASLIKAEKLFDLGGFRQNYSFYAALCAAAILNSL